MVVMLMVVVAVPVLLAGCGPQTPAAAVTDFYNSIQKSDWNAYLSTVLPESVRRMTDTDLADQKKKFLAGGYKYVGLRLKTIPDKKDPNKAAVEITSGVVKGKNPTTGQEESTTIASIKKQYGITPTLNTEKYKGRWYVNVPLATVDQPVQQQQ